MDNCPANVAVQNKLSVSVTGSPARNSARNLLFVKDRARAAIADGHHLVKSMPNALKNNGIIRVHIDYVKQKNLVMK